MSFNNIHYWPWLVLSFLVISSLTVITERRFFKFVKTYWFYKRSYLSYFATALFLSGCAGLLFGLLDLRGPEERVKTQMPSDRTIILIDTSASMLAEDVKPSRLQKATLIAKHFVRKAVGHQIAIVAFAEIQKKIVPFTADLDLIDARLDSIKNLRNQNGSSALSVAIQESIQYFLENTGEARGNLLVLTDGEETSEGLNLKIPKSIHVALVGIGTTQGGRIPLDDSRGFRFGYKKYRGQDVITKLDENFFKKTAADIASGKYWLASSYTLPSEEIVEFFQSEKVNGMDQQDMIIKPVRMEWVVVPALILMVLSYLLKSIRVFTISLFFMLGPVAAQDQNEKEIEIPEEIASRLMELQEGRLNRRERIKLADELSKAGLKPEAKALFEENLNANHIEADLPAEAYLNYGTTLLESGDIKPGLEVYKSLSSKLDTSTASDKIREMMDKNVTSLFVREEQKKKEQQKKNQQKKDQDKKDQKNNQKEKGSSTQDPSKPDESGGEPSDQKRPDKMGEQQRKDQDLKGDQQNKDKEKEKDKDGKEKEQKDDGKQPDDSEGNEQEKQKGASEKGPRPQKKIPAKLKQLMSDDRQLQMKIIENGTRDLNKRRSRESKDW